MPPAATAFLHDRSLVAKVDEHADEKEIELADGADAQVLAETLIESGADDHEIRTDRAELERHFHRAGRRRAMRKLLAVVKHEYRKIVLKWTFLIGTLLFPLIGDGFAVVPAMIFSMKGEPTRIVIVDPIRQDRAAAQGKSVRRKDHGQRPAKPRSDQTTSECHAGGKDEAQRASRSDRRSYLSITTPSSKSLEQVRQRTQRKDRGRRDRRISSYPAEYRIAGRGI